MRKAVYHCFLLSLLMMLFLLSGCKGILSDEKQQINTGVNDNNPKMRTIRYLGKEYEIPDQVERIVITGALEALEDALALGVKPIGVMTIGGKFPALFLPILQSAHPIGERMQPSYEEILKSHPDVILSSDKFPVATQQQLEKIATCIPLSHFAAHGDDNLRLLGELTGKQDIAERIIEKYKDEVVIANKKLSAQVKSKKVLAVRIRVGNVNVYPATTFFNDILYNDLAFSIPDEIKVTQAQEIISLEKLSEMNPDYLFIMQDQEENLAHPAVMEELARNPIWKNLKAVQDGKVFINVVDPLIQGVAIGGKIQFLRVAVEHLSK